MTISKKLNTMKIKSRTELPIVVVDIDNTVANHFKKMMNYYKSNLCCH